MSQRVRNEEGADEARFLDAIRSNADDNVVRLAYAEWLDRRDGVRAELIRSQIVLRSPVCTGRFECMLSRRCDTSEGRSTMNGCR